MELLFALIKELALLLQRQDPFVIEDLLWRVYDHRRARFIQFIRRKRQQAIRLTEEFLRSA